MAYSSILRQFITCLVPRVVEAPGQEAQGDIGASLGLHSIILCQFITCLVPRVVEAPGQEAQEDISASLG